MPSEDPLRYCLSRATRNSSMKYAAYASLLARALLRAGGAAAEAEAAGLLASAVRAWDFATTNPPAAHVPMKAVSGSEVVDVFYDESPDPPEAESVAKAAANLYALTGEARFAGAFTNLNGTLQSRVSKDGWSMSPLVLAELDFTNVPAGLPGAADFAALQTWWRRRVVSDADAWLSRAETAYPYRLPWYGASEGWVYTMSWGAVHPLRQALRFVAAHAMTGDARYLDAAFLANDYHCGCNPNGATWTSGLGREYPVGFLSLVSCSDGIGEYVEGITPYRNTYGLPQRAKEYVWDNDADEIRLWPFLRRWANIESQTVATSEYTVWETIGPAAAVTGYLMGPGLSPPVAPRTPAADVRDLPGYWSLP